MSDYYDQQARGIQKIAERPSLLSSELLNHASRYRNGKNTFSEVNECLESMDALVHDAMNAGRRNVLQVEL